MQMKWMFALALAAATATAGCGGGGAAPVTGGGPDETPALGSVSLSHPEGAVPVGDTMILVVEARDGAGQPVTGIQPRFTSSDPTVATVDAAGVVRGLKTGAATITASVTVGGITRTATYGVAILAPATPTPPAGAAVQGVEDAFSPSAVTIAVGGTVTWTMVDEEHDVTWTGAAPPGGGTGRIDDDESVSRTFPTAGTFVYTCSRHDGEHGGTVTVQGTTQAPLLTAVVVSPPSPSVAVGATLQLTATALDQAGRTMTGTPAAQWSTADAARATVSATGLVTGVAAGTVAITSRITHGGATREATVNVSVGGATTPTPPPTTPTPAPSATVTTPGESFSPASVTIGVGGTVTWQFTGSTRHNVTFNGTAPPGGNIPDTSAGGSAQRQFTAAGTYAYTCTRHDGMNGTVVVQP